MKTNSIAKLGVLAALSIVLVAFIHLPIFPAVSFLEYDPADVPILMASFAMGPGAGLVLTLVVSLIQGLTVSSASGWYGIVMHLIATGIFTLVSGLIYKKEKNKKRAVLALAAGSLSMAAVMIPANILLTPLYLQMLGIPSEAALPTVMGLLVWIILFNLVKAGINSLITFILYKRVSGILHK